MKLLTNVFLLLLTIATNLHAKIIIVPADIDSIQGGINLAVDGDTILVQPGTYVENINFIGKNIVVGSLILTTADTSYISQTVIDGNYRDSGVKFENGEDSTTVLTGFTIIKGDGIYEDGGGILLKNSNPTVSYLRIIDNRAGGGGGIFFDNSNSRLCHITIKSNYTTVHRGGRGGGILMENSNPILRNVDISENYARLGGGLTCFNSNPILINSTIINNSTNVGFGYGGGVLLWDNSNAVFDNVIVKNNITWDNGGGIDCADSNPSFSNVTIRDNIAGTTGGGLHFDNNSNPEFDENDRCNIYRNHVESSFGQDITSESIITVFVDTFTVLNPTEQYAFPLDKFTIDILHGYENPTDIKKKKIVPAKLALYQNYPNPFNPTTTVHYDLPKSAKVVLKIYNLLGKEVRTLVNAHQTAGVRTVTWDGLNRLGEPVSSGIYIYKMWVNDQVHSRKMSFIK